LTVLVHGSWDDHSTWQGVVPALAESFRVVTYDRRGHSRSERPSGQRSRREDEDDLAALLEALDSAPAHVSAFLDEQRDPEWAGLGLTDLARFSRPALLTQGDQSLGWFLKIFAKLDQAMEGAEVRTIPGAGHIPQETHPGAYVATLTDFIRRSRWVPSQVSTPGLRRADR
jgi:pimeloyl-ACP methyl ester carboxylesterase